jgi:hypothetical protein
LRAGSYDPKSGPAAVIFSFPHPYKFRYGQSILLPHIP